MKDTVNKNIEEWSKYPFCEQTQKEINILAKDKTKLHDAFYKNLEFGTGGTVSYTHLTLPTTPYV